MKALIATPAHLTADGKPREPYECVFCKLPITWSPTEVMWFHTELGEVRCAITSQTILEMDDELAYQIGAEAIRNAASGASNFIDHDGVVHGVIPDFFGGEPHTFTITPEKDRPSVGILECSCGQLMQVIKGGIRLNES